MKYVPRSEIEAVAPEAYAAIPAQFRDRIPYGSAAAKHTELLQKGFGFLQRFLTRLFERLAYQPGEAWPQWKLVAAFYLVEQEVGHETSRRVGHQVFSTMPWTTRVSDLRSALHSMEPTFRTAHDQPRAAIGGWPIIDSTRGRVIISSSNPYPCHFEEGVLLGICEAFASEHPSVRLLPTPKPKRLGGLESRFEVTLPDDVG